jgi:ATPase subunit of ABC transporter with duplicated ATPase domains
VLLLEGVTAEAVAADAATAEAGTRRGLDGLDLAVPRGECFGVVGQDATALRVLVELLAGRRPPTAGRVRIDGLDPIDDVEVLDGRVGVDVITSTAQPLDAADADVWLVLDARADAGPRDRAAVAARVEARHRGPHHTVLLATADRQLAAAVCGRLAHLVRGRLGTPTPVHAPPSPPAVHASCRC